MSRLFKMTAMLGIALALAACDDDVTRKIVDSTVAVAATAGTGGTILPASAELDVDETAVFTITPDAGYAIASVTGCAGTLDGNTYTTGPAELDCTVSATFIAQRTVTAVVSGSGGTVLPASATLDDGDTAILAITPAAGYVVDSITGCAGSFDGSDYTTDAVTANCTLTVSFRTGKSIYGGSFHTCSLNDQFGNRLQDGAGDPAAKCWGQNSSGQLGVASFSLTAHGDEAGESPADNDPVTNLEGLSITSMALGGQHSCAILSDANLYCFGEAQNGQLGLGVNADRKIMTAAVDLDGMPVLEAAAGGQFTCARLIDGTVRCWGLNSSGELATGDADIRFVPGPVVSLPVEAAQVAAGGAHACVRLVDDSVYCWGDNSSGQLGDSDGGNDSATPAVVDLDGGNVTDISAGGRFACVVVDNGVRCWGENGSGQLGNNDGTNTDLDVPSAVLDIDSEVAVDVELGSEHGCVLTQSGQLYCWGESDAGQTGQSDTTDDISPMRVDLGGAYLVRQLELGGDHTCVVLQPVPDTGDRPVRCWGEGGVGQLGLEDTSDIGDNEVVNNDMFNVELIVPPPT